MKQAETFLSKAFVISSIYLLVIILGGFFILPGIFQIDDYHFPLVVELFLKGTSAVAAIVVLFSAIIIPVFKLIQKPKQEVGGPAIIAAVTLLIGLIFISVHVLYVKLQTCPVNDSDGWHCHVEGKSYVGMLVLAFFFASLIGFAAWLLQKLTKMK